MTDYTYYKGTDVAAIEINADGTQRVIPTMTYDVQRYTYGVGTQRFWRDNFGDYVLAADAEAHEQAAVEAAVVRLTKTFLEQLTGDDDDVRRALEMAYVAGQEDMLATAIAKVEAAPDTFWAEAQDADELGWLQQHELYVAALRALLEGEK